MRLARETWIIAAIGVADLATTLLWVDHQSAHEANPIFAHYLRMGPAWFAVMKLVLLAGPLFLLEWARRRRHAFTAWASRLAIAGYVAFYAGGVMHVNADSVRDFMESRAEAAERQAAYERFQNPAYFRTPRFTYPLEAVPTERPPRVVGRTPD